MELLDVMKKRFSVRKYKEQQVEPEKLAKILGSSTRCTNSYQCAAGAADRGTE